MQPQTAPQVQMPAGPADPAAMNAMWDQMPAGQPQAVHAQGPVMAGPMMGMPLGHMRAPMQQMSAEPQEEVKVARPVV